MRRLRQRVLRALRRRIHRHRQHRYCPRARDVAAGPLTRPVPDLPEACQNHRKHPSPGMGSADGRGIRPKSLRRVFLFLD